MRAIFLPNCIFRTTANSAVELPRKKGQKDFLKNIFFSVPYSKAALPILLKLSKQGENCCEVASDYRQFQPKGQHSANLLRVPGSKNFWCGQCWKHFPSTLVCMENCSSEANRFMQNWELLYCSNHCYLYNILHASVLFERLYQKYLLSNILYKYAVNGKMEKAPLLYGRKRLDWKVIWTNNKICRKNRVMEDFKYPSREWRTLGRECELEACLWNWHKIAF